MEGRDVVASSCASGYQRFRAPTWGAGHPLEFVPAAYHYFVLRTTARNRTLSMDRS